jgi:hypothetical protein
MIQSGIDSCAPKRGAAKETQLFRKVAFAMVDVVARRRT